MNKLYRTPVVIAIILLLWPIVMAMIDPYDSLPEDILHYLELCCGVAVYLAVIARNIKNELVMDSGIYSYII